MDTPAPAPPPQKRASLTQTLLRPFRWGSAKSSAKTGGSKPPKQAYSERQLERARAQVAKLKAYGPVAGKPSTATATKATKAAGADGDDNDNDHTRPAYTPPTFLGHGVVAPSTEAPASTPANKTDSTGKIAGTLFALTRDSDGGFGFELLAAEPSMGIRVYAMAPDGSAARSGVRINSVVTEINDVDVRGCQYAEINQRIAQAGPTLYIRLESAHERENARREEAAITLQRALKAMLERKRKSGTTQQGSKPARAPAHNPKARRKSSSYRDFLPKRMPSKPKARTSTHTSTTPVVKSPQRKSRAQARAQTRSSKPQAYVQFDNASFDDTEVDDDDAGPITTDTTPEATRKNGNDIRATQRAPASPRHAQQPQMTPSPRNGIQGKGTGKWSNDMLDTFKEGGVRLKLVGSKVHPKQMGVYAELTAKHNRAPVFQRVSVDGTAYFMYYKDKAWMVSPVVGRKKCIISASSPAMRPDRVKSVWYEARGPKLSAMQGHPSIKALLLEEGTATDTTVPNADVRRQLRLV